MVDVITMKNEPTLSSLSNLALNDNRKQARTWPLSRLPLIKELSRNWPLYLMALPALLAIIIFSYVPLSGLLVAFLDYSAVKGIAGSKWVGLGNFQLVFQNPFFATALRNTLYINLMKLIVGFPAAIILSLLLNEIRLGWFKRLVQTATILPYFLSWVVIGTMFRNLLAPDGLVNEILQTLFHADPVIFLSDPQKFPLVIIFQDTWKYWGFGAVLYLASMSGIDPTLYEVAMIDGANRWQQTLYVTLPAIRPTMATVFILSVGWIIQGGFEQMYVMYNTSVYSTGDILETFTLRLALSQSKYGMATAVGLLQGIISVILVLSVNYSVRRFSRQGL